MTLNVKWPNTNIFSLVTGLISNINQRVKHYSRAILLIDCVWNVMAHVQKPDFVFRRNGRAHLNWRGASVQSTTGSRGVCISGSNAGYTKFRGSVKGTGYPLHLPVSPSLPLPCVTMCHHISNAVYNNYMQLLEQTYIKTTLSLSLRNWTDVYCLNIFLDLDALTLYLFKSMHVKRGLTYSWWMIKIDKQELNKMSQLLVLLRSWQKNGQEENMFN